MLLYRSEDFPSVTVGDVIEIYHEDENFPRLLLQVHSIHQPVKAFPAISFGRYITQPAELNQGSTLTAAELSQAQLDNSC